MGHSDLRQRIIDLHPVFACIKFLLIVFVDVSSGNVAALVGEAAVASTVSTSTVALAAVLAAVGSAMIVLIVVLAVRRIQTSRMIAENQSTVDRMNNAGASPYGFNNTGFNMPDEDALSSVSSTGTIS